MISMADAYRPGPDGQIDMDLFRQYANQQAGILNAQGGTGASAGNPNLTQGQQYLAANPDVFENATARATAEGIAPGAAFQQRLDEIAREHFDAFGQQDGRSGFGIDYSNQGGNQGNGFGAGQPTSGGPAFSQPTFDFSSFNDSLNTALGNFNGLLDSYESMLGGLFDTTNQVPSYGGGFLPFPTTLQGGFGPFGAPFFGGVGTGFNTGFGGGFGGGFSEPPTVQNPNQRAPAPAGSFGPGFGGGVAGTGHRQFFTI